MQLNDELVAEIDLLNLFPLDSSLAGLKIHRQASPARISAAARLYEKQLITQPDGGYLTPLGLQATELAQGLLTILQPATSH